MARIMVIDDDPNICSVLARVLIRHGHEVDVHLDGHSALRAFRVYGADLIVTDACMPETNGIELLLAVDELAPQVPVVVMSDGGIASLESVLTDTHDFGAVLTLAKPIEVDVFLAAMRKALSGPTNAIGGMASAG
jgi:DNA-binding NtrC family response regulator